MVCLTQGLQAASAVAVCAEIGHWAAKGYISKALASIWLEPYRLISADISNVNCLDVFQCAVGGGTAGGRGGAGRGQGRHSKIVV